MSSNGFCAPRFAAVREAFDGNLASDDLGASVAVTVNGELVVDLWGGWRDLARSKPWQSDTLVCVWSSTKTMAALCALVLADRGELALEKPVSHYWSEFGANGKEDVLVKHFLSHSSGVPGWEKPLRVSDLYDHPKATALLAAQAPWWKPGSASGYHALAQGHLVGEVVRRVTGRTLGAFFRDEIARPLGADFHIGLAREEFGRVAELAPPELGAASQFAAKPGSIALRTLANPPIDVGWTKTDEWRTSELPAANGHGNARAMARVQTALACGGTAFGKTILSPAGAARALELQTDGADLVLGIPVRFGLGFALPGYNLSFGPNPRTLVWGGYGGSLVVIDQDARVCIAYAMNRMLATAIVGDTRSRSLIAPVYQALRD